VRTDLKSIIAGLGKFPESSSIYLDYNEPLSDNIKRNIDMMVVDRNTGPYGESIKQLRKSTKLYMIKLYNSVSKGPITKV
jgi:hypothetical protein